MRSVRAQRGFLLVIFFSHTHFRLQTKHNFRNFFLPLWFTTEPRLGTEAHLSDEKLLGKLSLTLTRLERFSRSLWWTELGPHVRTFFLCSLGLEGAGGVSFGPGSSTAEESFENGKNEGVLCKTGNKCKWYLQTWGQAYYFNSFSEPKWKSKLTPSIACKQRIRTCSHARECVAM